MSAPPSPAAASFLMKGRLRENSNGDFNLDDAVSDGWRDDSISFLEDNTNEMTWSRKIALSLMKYKWYNPRAGEEDVDDEETKLRAVTSFEAAGENHVTSSEKPSLEKAWAYFEHVALDRYIVEDTKPKEKKSLLRRIVRKFQKGDKKLEKAEPGEKMLKTALYSPIFTPHAQLGDFGLGIGLYFSTLRAITIITFVLGLISIYNINYFNSDDYMPSEERNVTDILLKGSAICTNTPWVPCPTCICTSPDDDRREGAAHDELYYKRCGTTEDGLVFALKNDCDGTPWQLGAVNYITVILLLVATACLGEYLRRQEIAFDEDEQTAQDYSVKVSNPPVDAKDPEEWRKFFEDSCGAQVTVCTVAVDNDLLVRTLVERREIMRAMENGLEPGTSMSNLNLAYIAAKTERERNWLGRLLAGVSPGIPEQYARYVALNAKVQGLAQLDHPVTKVFLTFETEKDQRKVLQNLSVGSLQAAYNKTTAVSDPKFLFRNEFVLAVEEPDEPSTIRWQDLNAGIAQKMKEQALTAFATLCAIVVVAVVVRLANDASPLGAAFAISGFNSIFPIFAKMLTQLEAHAAEGEKQTSLYFKIAAFRWVNTAIVITIVTPFTGTLEYQDGLIPQIAALFFAEILTVSAIQLIDPMAHINRHFLAPRASTQDAMNLMFAGTEYELAERYTDMTKILFLCVWYCSIFPVAFFLCSLALFIKYFVDRFSLMRSWKRAPQLGTRVSTFSRRYFFSLACVAMAVLCSYYWSGFPFDNLCEDGVVDERYQGEFFITPVDGGSPIGNKTVAFDSSTPTYRFCSQDLLTPGRGNTFPFVPGQQPTGDEWMTSDQEATTKYFGWSSIVITILVIFKFVSGWVESIQGLYKSTYSAVGDDQNIAYSDVAAKSAYIPQVTSPLFSYPLLACDSSQIDEDLYEWTDPDRPHSFYDLTKDAKKLIEGMDVSQKVGFTVVRHWPPQKVDK